MHPHVLRRERVARPASYQPIILPPWPSLEGDTKPLARFKDRDLSAEVLEVFKEARYGKT